MYIETRKNKNNITYRTSITINGCKVNSPSFIRKTDCKNWFSKKLHERIDLKLYGDTAKYYQSLKISEYCELWLQTKAANGASRSTLKNYETYCRIHFIPGFQDMDLKKIQKTHVETFQYNLSLTNNPKGVNLIVGALKGLFREAIKDGYLIKSPCEFIKCLPSDTAHDTFWTESEINQFLRENYDDEMYEFYVVALNTGMRLGELCGLCFDRVNFQNNTLTITRTRNKYGSKDRTKTKLKRVIPMNELVRSTLLHIYYGRKSDEQLVFLKRNSEPIDPHHIYRLFHTAQRKAGFKKLIRFHDTRHTFASQFMNKGGSIYDLQKILGHTTIMMTMRYAHLSLEHLHSAMKSFSLGQSKDYLNPRNEVFFLKKESNQTELPQNSPQTIVAKY